MLRARAGNRVETFIGFAWLVLEPTCTLPEGRVKL